MAALRNVLLALLLAAVAAIPASTPSRTVAAMQDDDLGSDAEYVISESEFAEGTDETERDDEEDLNTEMDHVDEMILASVASNSSTAINLRASTPASERGDAGMCVPACYRHGKLSHKPKVKCDRFICKACAECYNKPGGGSSCMNRYSSMITRVKHGHAEIPGCGGKADSKDPATCKLPAGKSAFDTCDILGEKCAGLLVSHNADTVVLKGPYVEVDVKKGSAKWFMCVK
jgi:hypothetical protein